MSPLNARGICPNERFQDQPTMRNHCSAILVGPRQLLMPGNCITEHYCKNDLFYWMFNYQLDGATELDVMRPRAHFAKCKKLLKRVFDPSSAQSFALIELESDVVGVTPAKISKQSQIDINDELVAIGHPEGLPLKIAKDAYVSDQNESHFLVSSDIAGSALGTGIFNTRTYELEGMLISGRRNYENSESGCKRAPVFPFSETKELAIKINGLKTR